MTREEIREVYEGMVESYKRWIEHDADEIKWANDMLKITREDDKRLVEYIWSKGVLTEWEMERYTKAFTGTETKYYLKERARYYRERARDRARLRKAEEMLKIYS